MGLIFRVGGKLLTLCGDIFLDGPKYRDVPCRAVPGSGGSVPCQIFPCRALMIRAVPDISVPCRARILVPENIFHP